MGMYEHFTPIIHREGLTSSEVLIVEQLDALANSSSGQFLRKVSGSIINDTPVEAGLGTVTSVSVVTANGVSGTIATSTSTPAITLTLGAITPTTINGLTISTTTGTFTLTSGKTFLVSNTLTFTGTDASSVAFGAGGTVVYTTVTTLSSLTTIGTLVAGAVPASLITAGSFGVGAYVISTSLQVTTLELGAATDTTISRVSAGVIAVEGVTVDTISGTNTLTNKRITARVVTASDATSITPNTDSADFTYQANTQGAGTLTINADGGTPTNGQKWILKIKSTNVQTFSWNAQYISGSGTNAVTLPTASTGGSKIDNVGFIYDTVNSKWECVAITTGY